ncbi:hypothetical protein [Portibacter lacus]|uniref:Uncharacterized protein n=1 Tax=Portibacter lacus TaxID=1099794 RepID=A0AA37WF40_9BACT|nr:hypothetical protein [Portibacter lacus]GLR16590.1 hypothetical protein GCM10007940_12050 [Portibacter lacus]
MVPEKYITQLLHDINAAHKKLDDSNSDKTTSLNDLDDGLEAHFREVENYLEFDYEHEPTFGQIVDLEAIRFPKAELLNDDQLQRLLSAFYELLSSYNISVDLPKKLPNNIRYTLSLKILDESIFLSDKGHIGWEVCTVESQSCPLGEFCSCIEIEAEIEQSMIEAEEFLNEIIASSQDLIQQFGQMELRIGNPAENTADNLCIVFGGGNDHVPFEIYQNATELEKAKEGLQKLFRNDPEIFSLFDNISEMNIHKNLELLFSLKVEKIEGNTIYVEPYYIKDGLIYNGHLKLYTPEELMNKLESDDGKEK